MARNYYHPDTDFARKLGMPLPTATPHLYVDDIQKKLKRLMPNSWRLEGNELIGMTDVGELRQTIDPSYILTGTDEEGLPVFKKVVI